jgi:hypothetical protein
VRRLRRTLVLPPAKDLVGKNSAYAGAKVPRIPEAKLEALPLRAFITCFAGNRNPVIEKIPAKPI